jgi:LPXTG-site transpeptidase (sortase) family protein
MKTILNFFRQGLGRWQQAAGFVSLTLGLLVIWQPMSQASEDNFWHNPDSSVRREVTDMAMFGKQLSTSQPFQALAAADLKPGSGPVVPARLRIPAIQLDSSIESLGLHNGNMDVPNNIWNAGWLNSSPRPGDTGNAVIDGHKDSVEGIAVFWNLNKLKVGDRIYVSDEYGYELTFEVSAIESYDRTAAPLDRIFGSSTEKQLNLITCDGTFVSSQYSYDKRLVIYSHLVTNN